MIKYNSVFDYLNSQHKTMQIEVNKITKLLTGTDSESLTAFLTTKQLLIMSQATKTTEQFTTELYYALFNLCAWVIHNTPDMPAELVKAKETLKEYTERQAKPEPIDFTRINNDTNGNPRYVCHFLTFITDKDSCPASFSLALIRARKLGGTKFDNKQYGGGIAFQSYNTDKLQKDIFELMEQYK